MALGQGEKNADKQSSVSALQEPSEANRNLPPTLSLPRGGGAIRGIGEKFGTNPVTGTGSMTVPIATSSGRSGFGPQLALSYDSGAGNGPFGLGWNLSLPAITRKTDKGLPRYQDAQDTESDVFILSGAEDLVPMLKQDASDSWMQEELPPRIVNGITYHIRRYRPRVEGLFARIERWTNTATPGDLFWRSISKDNITTWYGRSDNSRIADHTHPERIFSWLICETYDDKGNIITYRYKAEDAENIDFSQVHQKNRGDKLDPRRTANRYLKAIRYGNSLPYFPKLEVDQPWPEPPGNENWYFEVVFDYGEHDQANPTPQEVGTWTPRQDSFSSYRSTFEVRTQRLCQRVLVFHHIPDTPNQKGYDGLVRSTDLTYEYEQDVANARVPNFSQLLAVMQRSYQRQADGSYLSASSPPVEFTYSDATIQTELRELRDDSMANLPTGIDGAYYQWIDLDGEGLSGVLTEQADTWFYKRNLSPTNVVRNNGEVHIEAKFAPIELVSSKPAIALADHAQFLDLAGDGRPDVVQFAGPTPGFYERTMNEQWDPLVPFVSLPNIEWNDANLKFIDLDGDGHADILISEDDAFVWHHSLGENGFDTAQHTSKTWDEEKGPSIVFADGEQSIYLADMSGDGLSDIVRIRNGAVCYWPNLGYGHFGAKITMDNAPLFDHIDQFDHRRIRLADIDGTATTDIVYLHREGVRVYFNQSGNSWSAVTTITYFPKLDNVADVQAMDLLGNGTACLVWSSSLPGEAHHPLRYLDLMGGQKPHLLVKTINNLGLETTVEYAPSTRFYLQDKQSGTPWLTKLPFPVHCVERVTVHDRWRNTTFSTTYSYHHGYFDGPEREFRGFGRVEQVDVEDYGTFAAGNVNSPYITDDKTLYQPPVKTVTWYHTGVFLDRERILSHFQDEYFPNWFEHENEGQQVSGTFQEHALPEPDLDALNLTPDEWREALRACKGMMLRQEIYELDVDALADGTHKLVKLFSTAYHNCHIHFVQPQTTNQHSVFYVSESEAITYQYELDLRPQQLTPDPRIAHTLNVSIDEYGNIQQSIAVVYQRLGTYVDATLKDGAQALIQQVQSELHLAYTETRYTNDIPNAENPDLDNYRLRLPCEMMTYELTGIAPTNHHFTLVDVRTYKLSDKYQNSGTPVEEIAYHLLPNRTSPQKRIVEHARTLFFDTSLDKPLVLGKLNALGLPYESYKLALSDDILTLVFKEKLTMPVKTALSGKQTSGYLSGDEMTARFGEEATSGQYWMCAGVAGFNADAAQHFYFPERYTDPFGNPTTMTYDPYDLSMQSSTDALGNRTDVIEFDYCVLAPHQMKDANDNLSEVRFDILGLPTALAVMGKGTEADNLDDFDNNALLNPDLGTVQEFFVTKDYNVADAKSLLRGASMRHLYYFGEIIQDGKTLWGQHPASVCSIMRERHVADELDSLVQSAFAYSDGTGNVLVKKVQAEPEQAGGPLRWVAGGKTILNNKGKPVKQYEPYFSSPMVGHRFEEPVEVGVTPVMYYDAVGRVIRTESPDGSYSYMEFLPWHVTHYDANDTVSETGNAWFAQKSASTASAEEQRAARLTTEHANTPSVTMLDSLGREVITIAHNRVGPENALIDEKYVTFSKLDAEGKPLWIQDPRGNRVMQYIMPPLPDGVHPFDDASNLTPQGFVPCYDIAGNQLFQHSMDAGDRWMLNDAAGKPMFVWSNRGFITRMEYDALHRPTGSFVIGADAVHPTQEIQCEKLVYGEGQANDKQRNLRGKLYEYSDTAAVLTSDLYDFKGNSLHTTRQLMADYKATPDWSQSPAREAEVFVASTRHDALNRPIQIIAPHSTAANPQRITITQPTYNEAGLLERVDVWLNQALTPTSLLDATTASEHAVTNIDYNAKGQRVLLQYGNGSETHYDYEPDTFRLQRLRTTRTSDSAVLQDLNYTYDPIGNITEMRDNAQPTIFFNNAVISPNTQYVYDPLYRLLSADGREHRGQTANNQAQNRPELKPHYDFNDSTRMKLAHPNDGQAMRHYSEAYQYDPVGNILAMIHTADMGNWTRYYDYAVDSNRLRTTNIPGDGNDSQVNVNTLPDRYIYDAHGNMTQMPHLPLMQWDFSDHLQASSQQIRTDGGIPEITYYVYAAGGQRVRKITERENGTRKNERTYLGGFEVYREYDGNGTDVTLERETLHVMDDKQRIALVEMRTQGDDGSPEQLIRYQLGNHLGSASLELDDVGQIISYEEYYPYGNTSYQAGRSVAEVSLKRYRYTGMERDEESGLNYHSARYFASWLGRWVSADPIGVISTLNLYEYSSSNPVRFIDPRGTDTDTPEVYLTPWILHAKDEKTKDASRNHYTPVNGLYVNVREERREVSLADLPNVVGSYLQKDDTQTDFEKNLPQKLLHEEAKGSKVQFRIIQSMVDGRATTVGYDLNYNADSTVPFHEVYDREGKSLQISSGEHSLEAPGFFASMLDPTNLLAGKLATAWLGTAQVAGGTAALPTVVNKIEKGLPLIEEAETELPQYVSRYEEMLKDVLPEAAKQMQASVDKRGIADFMFGSIDRSFVAHFRQVEEFLAKTEYGEELSKLKGVMEINPTSWTRYQYEQAVLRYASSIPLNQSKDVSVSIDIILMVLGERHPY
jgi:RHS repeat-associated protein